MPSIALPVLRGPLRGSRFILRAAAGRGGGASIHLGRSEREQLLEMASTLKDGDVVYDVGANIGFYTVLAARRVGPRGTVVAFEPVVRNLTYLERHVGINGLTNVWILPVAAGAADTLSFFSHGHNPATGHVVSQRDNAIAGPHRRSTVVPVATIDSVADLLDLDPAIVKIDVEGAELEVLRGAERCLRRARPVIFLSVHSEDLRQECLRFLRSFGYHATPLTSAENGDPAEFVCRAVESAPVSSQAGGPTIEHGE